MATILRRCSRNNLLKLTSFNKLQSFYNENNLRSNQQQSLRKTLHKREEVKKIRSYILTRYVDYIRNYEKVIEKQFPTALHLYRTFKVGMKEFYRDVIAYVKIIRMLNTTTDGLKTLTLQEIEIYRKMPKAMIKIAPVLLLSALPLTNYVIFPLAYFYPRQFLCSHFWTIQQRSEFQLYYLRQRLLYHRGTFRCMQAQLDSLKGHKLYQNWGEILGLIGSGVQPTTEQIIECKGLFSDSPYSIKSLRGIHAKYLLRIHGLHTHWFRRTRLREHARLLRAMDRAIIRENGVKSLSHDALRSACFTRGLNPINMRYDDMTNWLDQCFSKISQKLKTAAR